MGKAGDASIKAFDGEEFTCITFRPDLAKFKMSILDKDTVALMTRRAYDIAGSSKGVRVFFNGKRLPVSRHAVSLLCFSISASTFCYFLPIPCWHSFLFLLSKWALFVLSDITTLIHSNFPSNKKFFKKLSHNNKIFMTQLLDIWIFSAFT